MCHINCYYISWNTLWYHWYYNCICFREYSVRNYISGNKLQLCREGKNLTFKENLGLVYFVLPFIFVVENKVSLLCSILFGKSEYKIKIKNTIIKIPRTKFNSLRDLLACLTYAISYSLDSSGNLEISLDENSKFRISLKELSFEDANLLELLYEGSIDIVQIF